MTEHSSVAAPASSAAMRAIHEFVAKPQAWGILNGTPEDIEVFWGGERVVIPSCKRTTEPHPKAAADKSYVKFVSHRDDKGFIPGTLVIYDLTRPSLLGPVTFWSAKDCISSKLGINPETGEHLGQYGMRGLRLFALDATRAELETLRDESRSAWEDWAVRDATATMSQWSEFRRVSVSSGLPEPVPPRYVNDAATLLKSIAEKRGKEISDLLGGATSPANQMIRRPSPVVSAAMPVDLDALRAEMLEKAKSEIMASLLKDPEQLKALSAAVVDGLTRVPTPEKKAKP